MSHRIPQIKNQTYIFPELLADRVENMPHAARFFLYLAFELELKLYKRSDMGTPSYDRPTLMALIFFAMHRGYFSGRAIIKFAKDSIGATWIINGMKLPSYKTIDRIIDTLLEEVDNFFTQILEICKKLSLIGEERIYIDGVKIKANASKHKAMSYEYLGKKIESGKDALKVLFEELKNTVEYFENTCEEEITDLINDEADKVHYVLQKNHQKMLDEREEHIFNLDSEKNEKETGVDYNEFNNVSDILKNTCQERYDETLERLNNVAYINKRVSRMEDAKTELESKWESENGNKKIPDKKQINFTDADSCIMVTKHQGVQQCYNHFAFVDDKANIILGTHTSNNSSDQLGLIPTIENTESLYGCLEGFQLGADAGFFSADNIKSTTSKGIDFYASFPESKSIYGKDKFKYNIVNDTFTCPKGYILGMEKKTIDGKIRRYSNQEACTSCKNCNDCTKAKDKVRRIERDMENDLIREQAKAKAQTVEGKEILRLRKSIPEPVWGNIKTIDGLTQMHYRGLDKATLEFRLHSAIHNIRKILKVYFKSTSYQEIVHKSEWNCMKTA